MGFSWFAFVFRYTERGGSMALWEGAAVEVNYGLSDLVKALWLYTALFAYI